MLTRKVIILTVIVVLTAVLLLVYLKPKPKPDPKPAIVHEIGKSAIGVDGVIDSKTQRMKRESQFHYDMRKSLHEKNFDKASILLDSAMKVNAHDKMLITYKGMIFAGQGHHLAAIDQYNKAITPGKEDPYPLGNRATAYLELKMYDKAIADLRKASAVNSEYYFMLAYAFEQSGQSDSAKFYYTK